jgi:hypothetical protein
MKLQDILEYWQVRGLAHTTLALEGAIAFCKEGGPGAVVVMRSEAQARGARSLLGRSATVLTVDDAGEKLKGLTKPLFVDHWAMAVLCRHALQETEKEGFRRGKKRLDDAVTEAVRDAHWDAW